MSSRLVEAIRRQLRRSKGADKSARMGANEGTNDPRQKSPRPAIAIMSPTFRYTDSAHTDLTKTFARVRRQQRVEAQLKAERDAATSAKVKTLKRVNEGEKK